MKILYITSNLYPNTAYTNRNKAVVRGFKEHGCECDILSIRPVLTDEPLCLNNTIIPRSSKTKTLLYTAINLMKVGKLVKHYDVVYCVTYTQPIVRVVSRKSLKYKKLSIHEGTEFPDIVYSLSNKSVKSLNSYLTDIKQFDKILAISHPLKDYFVEHGVPADMIDIFPMIVDPHRFDDVKKQDVGFRYIAYCGNMNNSKDGIAELIEAFCKSNARKTHTLMLIGSNPMGTQKEVYDNLLAKYAIKDEIIFKGQVQRDDMPQLLMDADLLVLCRPNNRQALGGFPTKLGEYLSTGNPVLVTRVGDMDKYIIDGENGFLAEPDNIDGFAAKMDEVLADYDTARQVGKKGRELTDTAFNYSVQTKKIIDSIKTAINK